MRRVLGLSKTIKKQREKEEHNQETKRERRRQTHKTRSKAHWFLGLSSMTKKRSLKGKKERKSE